MSLSTLLFDTLALYQPPLSVFPFCCYSFRIFQLFDLASPNRMVTATGTSTFGNPSTGDSSQQPKAGAFAQAEGSSHKTIFPRHHLLRKT